MVAVFAVPGEYAPIDLPAHLLASPSSNTASFFHLLSRMLGDEHNRLGSASIREANAAARPRCRCVQETRKAGTFSPMLSPRSPTVCADSTNVRYGGVSLSAFLYASLLALA